MRGWTSEDYREMDRSHDRHSFETATFALPLAEAAATVGRAAPRLVRVDHPGVVQFRNPHRTNGAVVATLTDRPGPDGTPGIRLQYRVAYRTPPPLRLVHPTSVGRRVRTALADRQARLATTPPARPAGG